MVSSGQALADIGLEVVDLSAEDVFETRAANARRQHSAQVAWMQRLAAAFVERPDTILQELVEAAVNVCGADSAGISIEREDRTEAQYYHWVATAGVYSGFMNATLPFYPSACTICLERGTPQHFRVHQRFFEILGVEAPTVKDGILLPWEVEGMRGTIFIISHEREVAFDSEDLRLMQMLASFAAMGVRNSRQQKDLLVKEGARAAASMANDLAHEINNPLQALTNRLYLAATGEPAERELALALLEDFERLQVMVKRLLDLAVLR